MGSPDSKKPHVQGAKWVRACLQVNPFGYKGRSAPSASFKDEDSYNTALLDRCCVVGIGLIAVTDHWCIDTAGSLIRAATSSGIVALPGFEANSAEGVHLLVLFEADTDFAEINAAIGGCGATPGCPNGTIGSTFHEIVHAMTERGALVIPAHVNVANGGMLTGRTGPPLVSMVTNPDLHAIAITPGVTAAPEQQAVCRGSKPYDRPHPLAVIHADDVSHPDTLETPGASTWFKVSSACLESIKLAVRTPETRVATGNPVTTQRPLIRQISWTGGFLDGVTIPLSADLTALIGGRGTGKSTVIESLRYALDIEPFGEAARRDHQAIVSGVLRSGTTVRVEIETVSPTARRFAIERSVPNPPLVRDSSGTATNLRPEDVIGLVEVFGQHELAELAHDKTSVARMLERFAGAEGPDREHEEILEKLRENREKLQRAEKARNDLDSELADVPRLEEHVKHYIDTDLPTRLGELQRLNRDESVFAEGIERIGEARRVLHPLTDAQVSASINAPIDHVDDSPQSDLLQRVAGAMSQLSSKLAELSAAAETALENALCEVEAASQEWKTATDGQRSGHAEVLRKLVEDGHDPDKYLTTTAALEALKAKASRRDGITTTITNLLQERSELLGKLAAHEVSRSTALADAIRAANAATSGVVVVRPIPSPNRRNIKSVIEDHVSGVKTQIMAAVDAPDFSPRAFAAAVRGGVNELAKLDIRGAQASNLIGSGEGLLRELEELSVGQAVEVLLDIAAGSGTRELRSLDDLSKGQRATALLLLLLGASSAPLIIDQPEDDLDNRFIYDGIVQRLRQLKGTRQIIASTHNANVPVLGDAELIVALEGDGQRGWPIADGIGSLDDAPIRAHAENLLEGGSTAFNARQHLYGF